jgi:hypothetical protein
VLGKFREPRKDVEALVWDAAGEAERVLEGALAPQDRAT